MLLDRFLNSENVRKDLALVVRRPSRKHVAVLQDGLERRRIPKFQRIRRLHIVMAVNQNCRTTGPVFIAGPDDGMTFRRYKLRLQTDPVELVHQPVCTLDQLFLVLVVSRDAWKPQERIILLEIIVAHGARVNPRSYERPILTSDMGNSCRAGASPARPMTRQAERLPYNSPPRHPFTCSARATVLRTKYKRDDSASTIPVTRNSRTVA